jgi:hypothetical protein
VTQTMVRPEVAGPMTSSTTKQSNNCERRILIASPN